LKNARHARDRLPRRYSFADKQGKDEVVRAELCFANEIAQAGALPQAARPMNQFPHRPRLSVLPGGRKLTARQFPLADLTWPSVPVSA